MMTKVPAALESLHSFECFNVPFAYNTDNFNLYRLDVRTWLRLQYFDRLNAEEITALSRQLDQDEVRFKQTAPAEISETDKDSKDETSDYFSLCLILTHNCNLNCLYCFDREQRKQNYANLSPDKAKEVIEVLIDKGYHRIVIWFFGGEPLLRFDQIKRITEYCKYRETENPELIFRFTITTNGTLLTETIMNFLEEHHFSMMFSHDGSAEIVDAQRPQTGSLDTRSSAKIEKALDLALKYQDKLGSLAVRATITRGIIPRIPEIYRNFRSRGIRRIFLCPACGSQQEMTFTEEDAALWIQSLEKLVLEIVENGDQEDMQAFPQIFDFVDRLENRSRNIEKCGLGKFSAALDSDGQLYACHRFIPRTEFKLDLSGISGRCGDRLPARRRFESGSSQWCGTCWANKICGSGGCPYLNEIWTGDISTPYGPICSVQKRIIELACWALWKLKKRGVRPYGS